MAVGLGSQIFSSIEVFDGCAMETKQYFSLPIAVLDGWL